jgi:hypothetical protein
MGGAKRTKTTTGAATVARSGEGCRAHVESVQTTSQAGGPASADVVCSGGNDGGGIPLSEVVQADGSKRNAAGGLVLPWGGCRPCVGVELTCETAVLGGIAKEVRRAPTVLEVDAGSRCGVCGVIEGVRGCCRRVPGGLQGTRSAEAEAEAEAEGPVQAGRRRHRHRHGKAQTQPPR